ncbi:MAG: extracellular solute-binding protein [Bacteroides sp.]|nr:extracellular solute-binding protein [Bacillota bacterium]MCM1394163.1 extracellular solute-binding protein [[Eubacterium] siraeum]MCM1455841.1 extracellular solute-binding protein [Bacteroides sp.]
MKKITKKTALLSSLIALFACLLLPTLAACNKGEAGATDRLVIYNWEDYIDLNMCDDFADYYKEVTGRSLDITYTTYDTNETMMTKVLKNDANVDLICPSEYSIQKLMLAGCLENHLDIYEQIKPQLEQYDITLSGMSSINPDGYGNIEPSVIDAVKGIFSGLDDGNGNTYDMTNYMVPYFYGTLGILYNTSVVSQEELEEYGWGVLWNVQNNKKLENKILMKDSVRDSYAAAIFYMYEYGLLPDGYENATVQDLINCTDDVMLEAAERVLTEQREHISGYEVDFGKDDMVNEIVYADLAWSGDAMFAIEEGDYDEDTDTYQLDYYVPPIASNIWYDGWVIPKTVKNKLAAMMFIEYMCNPINGIRNSMEVGYTSAVARDLLSEDEDVCDFIVESYSYDEDGKPFEVDNDGNVILYDVSEYFADERRYPEIDDTLGVMRDFGEKNDAVVQMWQRAKSGKGVSHALWWCLLAVVLAIGVAVGGYYLAQALKLRPRKIKDTDLETREQA